MQEGQLLWQPSDASIESSMMHDFMQYVAQRQGLALTSYHDLWAWSVADVAACWASVWDYFQVEASVPYTSVCVQPADTLMGTQWFTGAKLSYARHVFRSRSDVRPALLFASERHPLRAISWAELADQVTRFAGYLRAQGVGPGDRVVAFLPNIPEAVVAFLATNSLGAVWSSCSPDFGVAGVVERFQQIEPKVLIAADGYVYGGKAYSRMAEAAALAAALPTLRDIVILPYLDPAADVAAVPGARSWTEAMDRPGGEPTFEEVPFNHPIWVLYSSGTTGRPKAITHSTGGILLEHFKALGLHHDCRPGDRFFWYSTTGWMMWNYANSALLLGATVLLYDGAAGHPDLYRLWELAGQADLTHFGGGAAYFIACMKAGLDLRGDLPRLRSVGSTGSPLPADAFGWLYTSVKSDLWLVSLSGGTDVCSGFVGGSPLLPVHAGEIQCRMLGCKVEAFDEQGASLVDALGEMVLTQPMPSMPVFFWNDPGGQRYRESYFVQYPGHWRHGDWVKITGRGSLVIYGRSDATLNRGGVRIGTSEVYAAIEGLGEIQDSLVVSVEQAGGQYYMPLFVVLAPGQVLDEALRQRIVQALRTRYSPRHVPDDIIAAPAVPYTISGKKMETPVKKLLMGMAWEQAASEDAMKNPEALAFYRDFARQRAANLS
ncbi:MAG: acetoacetate--CoA ligase [Bacteroidia bacterium]